MNRLFLTDLDHTLFNTELYYHHVRHVIENEFNVSAEVLHEELREQTKHVGPYNVFSHVRQHDVDTDRLKEILKKELYGNDYLFKDAKVYLSNRKQKGEDVAIITVGYEESQNFKIDLVPMLHEYPRIITRNTKAEELNNSFEWNDDYVELKSNSTRYEHVILIDDRSETFMNLKEDEQLSLIRLRRLYETHSEMATLPNITEIHNLIDIEAVINTKN